MMAATVREDRYLLPMAADTATAADAADAAAAAATYRPSTNRPLIQPAHAEETLPRAARAPLRRRTAR